MSSRRRPLHTSGVAILSIAHIAHIRSQEFSGPLGSMARKLTGLAEFACPLLYALQYHLFAALSFGDDLILDIEDRVETLFPPSKHVFDTTDKLVEFAETLPGMFDDAVKEFLVIIHQYSLLDWGVNQVISWLNCWISMLMHLEFGYAKEKEIRVDTTNNSKECKNESSSPSENKNVESTLIPDDSNKLQSSESDDAGNFDPKKAANNKEVTKGSYKEVLLEKGKREKENKAKKDKGNNNKQKTRKTGCLSG